MLESADERKKRFENNKTKTWFTGEDGGVKRLYDGNCKKENGGNNVSACNCNKYTWQMLQKQMGKSTGDAKNDSTMEDNSSNNIASNDSDAKWEDNSNNNNAGNDSNAKSGKNKSGDVVEISKYPEEKDTELLLAIFYEKIIELSEVVVEAGKVWKDDKATDEEKIAEDIRTGALWSRIFVPRSDENNWWDVRIMGKKVSCMCNNGIMLLLGGKEIKLSTLRKLKQSEPVPKKARRKNRNRSAETAGTDAGIFYKRNINAKQPKESDSQEQKERGEVCCYLPRDGRKVAIQMMSMRALMEHTRQLNQPLRDISKAASGAATMFFKGRPVTKSHHITRTVAQKYWKVYFTQEVKDMMLFLSPDCPMPCPSNETVVLPIPAKGTKVDWGSVTGQLVQSEGFSNIGTENRAYSRVVEDGKTQEVKYTGGMAVHKLSFPWVNLMEMNILDQADPFLKEPIGKGKKFQVSTVPVKHAPGWTSYVVWKDTSENNGNHATNLSDLFVPGPNENEMDLKNKFLSEVKSCVHFATYKADSAGKKIDDHEMSLSHIRICATRDYRCEERLVALVPGLDIDPGDLEEQIKKESEGGKLVSRYEVIIPLSRDGAMIQFWPDYKHGRAGIGSCFVGFVPQGTCLALPCNLHHTIFYKLEAMGTPVLKMRCTYWERNGDWKPEHIKNLGDCIPVGQTSSVGLKLPVPNTSSRDPGHPDVHYRHEDQYSETDALGRNMKKIGMFAESSIKGVNKEMLEDDSTSWMIGLMFPAWCWLLKESTYPCMDLEGLLALRQKHDTGDEGKDNVGVKNNLEEDTKMTANGEERND